MGPVLLPGHCGSAASNIVGHLVDIGVLEELTGRTYGRTFGATDVMKIVEDI
jgi:hypothetical protein